MPEQRFWSGVLPQWDRALGQNASIGEKMAQLSPSIAEDLADEKSTVAFARSSAATEHNKPVLGCAADELVNRLDKGGCFRHLVVESMTLVVEVLVTLGSPAESAPKEYIANG